jgi:hypothetical protein
MGLAPAAEALQTFFEMLTLTGLEQINIMSIDNAIFLCAVTLAEIE